jgi:hypothetical protein
MPLIEVFKAMKAGKLRYIGLSADQIYRRWPRTRRGAWVIKSEIVEVGEATGVIHIWEGGLERIHWTCPLCGGLHISDFLEADGNPVLWFCERPGGRMCLVTWSR